MKDKRPSPPINTLITGLALWLIRWTALLGALGLVALYFDNAWLMAIGIGGALIDLCITLLNEARLAENRSRSITKLTTIQDRLGKENADDDR